MLIERLQDVFVWPSENRRSGASDRHKKNTRKAPGALDPAVVLPPLRVENLLRSLKIQVRVAKDTASICLAEQKPGVWGK